MIRSLRIAALGVALLVSACSSTDTAEAPDTAGVTNDTSSPADTSATSADTSDAAPTTTPAATEPASTTAPAPEPGDEALDVRAVVERLASDELEGRDNGTEGSRAAQRLLIDQLAQFAQPAYPDRDGDDGFLQSFSVGTNVLAVIPGGELADQYVIIGAHYDHLGMDCPTSDPDDSVCNGATDNATGVAAALAVARALVADGTPRRSVLLAFWDAEEDRLDGSAAYVATPVVPLAQTTGYVNFDIQGASLLPALRNTTVAVGAETGGPNLVEATTRAAGASTLETLQLSLLFGQGRSDHANFVAAGVPSVFFTDANTPCYHTTKDDLQAVDFAKLDQQIATATALSRDLVGTDTPPAFDPAAPASTYGDAVSMLAVTTKAEPDFDLLGPTAAASSVAYIADLQAIVDAGPDAFDEAAVATLLGGAVTFVDALTQGECTAAAQ